LSFWEAVDMCTLYKTLKSYSEIILSYHDYFGCFAGDCLIAIISPRTLRFEEDNPANGDHKEIVDITVCKKI
jgi:hypothetical protein